MRDDIAIAVVLLLALSGMGSPSAASSSPSGGRARARAVTWSDAELEAYARELGPIVSLEPYLSVLALESGLDPAASSGSAWGLNQAQGALLFAAGWPSSPAAFGNLDVQQQLPWIAKMLRRQINAIGYTPSTAAELLRMQLSPRAARDRSDVVFDARSDATFYAANSWLDRNKTGRVTMADLARELGAVEQQQRYRSHVERLRALRRLLP